MQVSTNVCDGPKTGLNEIKKTEWQNVNTTIWINRKNPDRFLC